MQGFATAEIIPLTVYYLWLRMKEKCPKSKLVNTVHDSIVAMVHKDEVNQFIECCKAAFTSDVYGHLAEHYGYRMVVPLGTEIKVGKYWGDGSVAKVDYELEPKEYFEHVG